MGNSHGHIKISILVCTQALCHNKVMHSSMSGNILLDRNNNNNINDVKYLESGDGLPHNMHKRHVRSWGWEKL